MNSPHKASKFRNSIAMIGLAVIAALAWYLFGGVFVPSIIEDAYNQTSHSILNQIISGRADHPLAFYIQKWERVYTGVLMCIPLVVCGGFYFYTLQCHAKSQGASRIDMTRWRLTVVYLCIAVVVGGMLFDILANRDDWPFSNYPMYSAMNHEFEARAIVIYGVDAAGQETPFSDWGSNAIRPFDASRLNFALQRLQSRSRSSGDTSAMERAVLKLLRESEVNKGRDVDDPRALVGLRVYECQWEIQSGATNATSPDLRTLLVEVVPTETTR